jgi:acyl-CoA thioester hydrolase
MNNLQEKIAAFNFKTPIPLRFSDMDMFGHANNAVYLTYFEQARSQYWKEILHWNWDTYGIVLVKSELEYIKPITL